MPYIHHTHTNSGRLRPRVRTAQSLRNSMPHPDGANTPHRYPTSPFGKKRAGVRVIDVSLLRAPLARRLLREMMSANGGSRDDRGHICRACAKGS